MKSQNRMRLGLIVLAGGLLLFAAGCRSTARVSNGNVKANELRPFSLTDFRSVYGTAYLIAGAIQHSEKDRLFSSYEGKTTTTHNQFFLNPADLSHRWLLPHSDFLFVQTQELPLRRILREGEIVKETLPPPPPTQLMLYTVVKADTNDIKGLENGDRKTIAVSAVSGNGYTEIIQDVDAIIHQQMHSPDEFLLVYRSGAKHVAVKLNLKTQQLTQTNELAPIPKAQTPLS